MRLGCCRIPKSWCEPGRAIVSFGVWEVGLIRLVYSKPKMNRWVSRAEVAKKRNEVMMSLRRLAGMQYVYVKTVDCDKITIGYVAKMDIHT